MTNAADRIRESKAKLDEIQRRRKETNDPLFGRDAEWQLVDSELRDIEREIAADPGALIKLFAPIRRKS
jgi:hypothetical protein